MAFATLQHNLEHDKQQQAKDTVHAVESRAGLHGENREPKPSPRILSPDVRSVPNKAPEAQRNSKAAELAPTPVMKSIRS